jgi:hypothetical protein
MFFYEIGYSGWDAKSISTLSHKKKFREDDFREILLKAYVIANEKTEKLHNDWFNDWLEEKVQSDTDIDSQLIEEMIYKPTTCELNQEVIDVLIRDFGFKRINITHKFIPNDDYLTVDDTNSDCDLVNMIRNRFLVTENRDKKINKILK